MNVNTFLDRLIVFQISAFILNMFMVISTTVMF